MITSLVNRSKRAPKYQIASMRRDIRAFGADACLITSDDEAEVSRRCQDLKNVYEPFLASRVLPKQGVCVDIGAGAGWFAIPFALAFPKWTVVCFEGDPVAFKHLVDNAKAAKVENVIVVPAEIHPQASSFDGPKRKPGEMELSEELQKALSNPGKAAFVKPFALTHWLVPAKASGNTISLPAFAPDALAHLAPDFVKIDKPGSEEIIAQALKDVSVGFIVGRLWSYISSAAFQPGIKAGDREFYLPYGRDFALRRDYEDNFTSRKRNGLDVVVAMYNTKDYIVDCIDSLIADGNPEINVIVVDDGSTDGCDAIVRKKYGNNPRVRLLQKANGGCASARNFGRQASDASHIAFIDADDRVDPGMFTALLEAARYTKYSVVQAEFKMLYRDENGNEYFEQSHETKELKGPGSMYLGPYRLHFFESAQLTYGQPTIWRRIHRRDFLDNNNIWFPEHVRAFDDQIFQLLVAHYGGAIAHLRGYAYHYRQHPAQDIKQGDERHFYSFNMFRKLLQRAIDENWHDMEPIAQSLLNTITWSYGSLRDDLKPIYRKATIEFLAVFHMTFGHRFASEKLEKTGIESLDLLLERRLKAFKGKSVSYAYIREENWMWQPELIRMMQAVKKQTSEGL